MKEKILKNLEKAWKTSIKFIDGRWQELTLCFLAVSLTALFFACSGILFPEEKTKDVISDWGLSFHGENETPQGNVSEAELENYNAHFIGNPEEKRIYLTFDAGYENGYMPQILDTLKKTGVKATFFLVGHYLKTEPDLVFRMVSEGHTVGNHTNTHPDMSKISDKASFTEELSKVEGLYNSITAKKMLKLYRPPQGKFSVENLKMASEMGYTTVFWSLAYRDWENDNQPDPEDAKALLNSRIHNGAVVLLHANSKTNAEILEDLILTWKQEGYVFGELSEFIK